MEVDQGSVPSITESTPAVSFVLDVPAGDLRGWVVLGEMPTGEFKVSSSICCVPHLACLLSTAVAQIADGLAEGIRPQHVT